jgi:hypothetical protein
MIMIWLMVIITILCKVQYFHEHNWKIKWLYKPDNDIFNYDREYLQESKWFYKLKTTVCLLFYLEKPYESGPNFIYVMNSIPVFAWGKYDNPMEGTYSWREISVGKGLFTNWYFVEYPNGT